MEFFKNASQPLAQKADQPPAERSVPLRWRALLVLVALVCVSLGGPGLVHADSLSGTVFASSTSNALLQYPEGITSWQGVVYTATYNVVNPSDSRIFAYRASDGQLINTIGGNQGQGLVSSGALLGLTIDHTTGDLYAAANFTGEILRIQNPTSPNAQVSVYATVPSGGGPEDLVFYKDGTLLSSDSNLGVVYAILPGGGKAITLLGPPGSGALVSDHGLFFSGNSCAGGYVAGLSPNGIVFSRDWKTLYVANTWADSIIAFDVTDVKNMGNPHVFAQNVNDDLEEYPTGFAALLHRPPPPLCSTAPYGTSAASTPLNGPDGLALDSNGNIWVASNLGDNLTVLDGKTGKVIATYGTSKVTQGGLLNQPSGMTFVGTTVYCTNLGIFTGLAGSNLPFTLVSFNAGVTGAGGNGNY